MHQRISRIWDTSSKKKHRMCMVAGKLVAGICMGGGGRKCYWQQAVEGTFDPPQG